MGLKKGYSFMSISLTLQPQKKSNQQPRSTKSVSGWNNWKQKWPVWQTLETYLHNVIVT